MKGARIKAMGLVLSACMITGSVAPGTLALAAGENAETVYESEIAAEAEEKAAEQSTEPVTEPVTDEPSTDEPSTDEPSTDEPSTEQPPAELPKEEIPKAVFDAATMMLTNVEAGMKYSIDGGTTWTGIANTSADLSKEKLSEQFDIRIVREGKENVSTDSEAQFLDLIKSAVPSQPEVSVTDTVITVKGAAGQEYSLKAAADTAEGAWGTAVEFKDLKEGTDYIVSTRIAGKGLTLPSDGASVTVTTKITALAAPTLKADMVDTGTVSVSWSTVPGAQTYTLYRSDDDKRTYKAIATLKETKFTDTTQNGLVSGKNYYYKVAASKVVNGVNYNSPMSSEKRGFTKLETPKLKLTQKNRANVLTWDEVPNAQLYRVYRSTKKSGPYSRIATVSDPTYTDKKFVRDTRYYYKIRATRQVDKTTYYSLYSSIRYTLRIKKPIVIHTEMQGNKWRVVWAKYNYSDGVVMYWKDSKKADYKKARTFKDGSTKFTSAELTKGKTYYFKLRHFRNIGGKRCYGAYSKVYKVTAK